MALRWRKNARETGLAAVCAGPRGSGLYDGDKHYASVNANKVGFSMNYDGWYWVACSQDNIPHKNTCDKPCDTEAEAKKAAMEYVKKHIK
jgi:hypothetical protein